LYNVLTEFGIPMKLARLIKMCLNETCNTVQVGKHLCDMLPTRNGLKQIDALTPLVFNFAVEYAIRTVQVNHDGLKIKRTHKLFYADDVNILGGSVQAIKENTEARVVASKEIGLEVNAKKKKTWSCLEIKKQDEVTIFKTDNRSFERVGELKFWEQH